MKDRWLKVSLIFTFVLSLFSAFFLPSSKVEASSTEVTQTYVNLIDIYRDDNTIFFTTENEIKVKDITYERVYNNGEENVSDLIVDKNLNKEYGTNEYSFNVDENTLGVKIWKVKHQVDLDYYKNKFTTGSNSVGDIVSKSKKNYITVTADKLESYEFACKDFELPWYMWSAPGISYKIGDYLFNREYCASYTWYFSLDTEMDRIESLSLEYATFTYTEALWGLLESKHDYKTYQIDIDAEERVYDYKTFINFANENCNGISACNSRLFDQGIEYFEHSAFGKSDEEGYDWYVQVSLNDLLKENNVLWGAYENHDYLQEVTLIKISYWFEGEYFEDVPVLDEDTGELIVKSDDSPIDVIVKFLDGAKNWIEENLPLIIGIGVGILVIIFMPIIMKIMGFLTERVEESNEELKKLSSKKKEGA